MSENRNDKPGFYEKWVNFQAQRVFDREREYQDAESRRRIIGKLLTLMAGVGRNPNILQSEEFLEIFAAFVRISFKPCPICGGPAYGMIQKGINNDGQIRPIMGVNCDQAVEGKCIMTGVTNVARHAVTGEPRFLTPAELAGLWNQFTLEAAIHTSLMVSFTQPKSEEGN